jgi:hypothetical protein
MVQLLLYVWLAVTVVLVILLVIRGVLESRERGWLPIASGDQQLEAQEKIEKEVHFLTPVIHWVGALDVVLLVALAGIWIYTGLTSVQM